MVPDNSPLRKKSEEIFVGKSLVSHMEYICLMVFRSIAKAAKFRGKKRNKTWQNKQILWWNGVPYLRDGQGYQQLLIKVYKAMFDQSESFRNALKASGIATFKHSLGSNKEAMTVLTEREFCQILTWLRSLL
jgi:hypothetical protein